MATVHENVVIPNWRNICVLQILYTAPRGIVGGILLSTGWSYVETQRVMHESQMQMPFRQKCKVVGDECFRQKLHLIFWSKPVTCTLSVTLSIATPNQFSTHTRQITIPGPATGNGFFCKQKLQIGKFVTDTVVPHKPRKSRGYSLRTAKSSYY